MQTESRKDKNRRLQPSRSEAGAEQSTDIISRKMHGSLNRILNAVYEMRVMLCSCPP
jgi:hypothetical protein